MAPLLLSSSSCPIFRRSSLQPFFTSYFSMSLACLRGAPKYESVPYSALGRNGRCFQTSISASRHFAFSNNGCLERLLSPSLSHGNRYYGSQVLLTRPTDTSPKNRCGRNVFVSTSATRMDAREIDFVVNRAGTTFLFWTYSKALSNDEVPHMYLDISEILRILLDTKDRGIGRILRHAHGSPS